MRRSSPNRPGLTRRRRGSGFEIVGAHGETVRTPEVLQRIRALAIPPAWTDVWICPSPEGHLQAVGTDAAGRRQYLYHAAWTDSRGALKRQRMTAFASALPGAREQVVGHLRAPDLTRNRALAVAFRVLDQASIRVGSPQYAVRHATYGLASLLRDHVHVTGGERVWFDFPGKTGRPVAIDLHDRALARAVTQLKRRRDPNPRLLGWRSGRGDPWHPLGGADINDYIRDVAGGPYTAKDFRTWNASVLMAVELSVLSEGGTTGPNARVVSEAVRHVAGYLVNTPAVARSSYIDGRIAELFSDGVVLPAELATLPAPAGHLVAPETEAAVLEMLTRPRRARRAFAEIAKADDVRTAVAAAYP